MLYLEGCTIAVPADDDEAWDVIERMLLEQIKEAGGNVRKCNEEDTSDCTHVLVERADEAAGAIAKQHGQQTVTLMWLHDCVESSTLLPCDNEKLYNGDFVAVPLTASEFVVTTTAYQGFKKVAYGRMIRALGLTATKTMNPKATDVVIAGDVNEKSPKIDAALANGIPVVSVLWLYDSIRQSTLQGTERYSQNPPRNMDPFHGALAKDCSLEVVANSGSSDDEEPPPQTEVIDWGGSERKDQQQSSVPKKGKLDFTPASFLAATSSNSHSNGCPPNTLELKPSLRDSGTEQKERHRLSLASKAVQDTPSERLKGNNIRQATPNGNTSLAISAAEGAPPETLAVADLLQKSIRQDTGDKASESGDTASRSRATQQVDDHSLHKELPGSLPKSRLGEQPEEDKAAVRSSSVEGAEALNTGATDATPANVIDEYGGGKSLMDGVDMSEMVAAANADVDMLVNHLVPDASQPLDAYPPELTPEPESHQPVPEAPPGVDGADEAQEKERNYRIPVVSDAPLASLQHQEPVDEDFEEPARPPPKRRRQNAAGVSWMAEPVRKRRKKPSGDVGPQDNEAEMKDNTEEAQDGALPASKPGSRRAAKPKALSKPATKKQAAGPSKEASPNKSTEAVEDASKSAANTRRRSSRVKDAPPVQKAGVQKNGNAGQKVAKNRKVKINAPEDEEREKAKQRSKGSGTANGKEANKELTKKRSMFSVSGMHSKQRETVASQLRELGHPISLDLHNHNWDERITHIVLPKSWVRGAKVLAGMAAGVWFVREDYLKDSAKAHSLLEEEDYEVARNPKKTTSDDACQHWRLARKSKNKPAFDGLKFAVYGEFEAGFRPQKSEVISVLQAGGAQLLSVAQAKKARANFVVTKPSRSTKDSKVKQLLGAGQCVVFPMFIVDWLAFPQKALDEHLMDGSEMDAVLSEAVTGRSNIDGTTSNKMALRMNAGGLGQPSSRPLESPSDQSEEESDESQIF